MAEKDIDLDWLIEMLVPAMEGTRQRRKSIENEWLLNYRAWQGWPSQNYILPLPDKSIHYFIPFARIVTEKKIAREAKILLPNKDWHQTLPRNYNIPHEVAEAVHEVMSYIYTEKYHTKDNAKIGLRCLELYNFTVQNTSPIIDINNEVWPYQEAVDPFNFYIFPDTARDTQQAIILFEDTIIPYQIYDSYVDEDSSRSIYKKIEASELATPVWPYHIIERIAYRGLSSPSDFIQGTGTTKTLTETQRQRVIKETRSSLEEKSKAFVSLSKIYFRLGSTWYYCVLCNNIKGSGDNRYNCKVVRLDHDNIYPLYRWTNTRLMPGELYTNSSMDDRRVAQNLTNNAMSDVEANRTQFAQPPIAMDVNGISRTEGKTFANRKVWFTDGNPNDLIKSLDVQDTSTNGYRAWQAYREIVEDSGGGGITEGMPGRNMPRGSGAANNLLNMALTDIEDTANTYETNILTPGLSDTYYIVQTYIPNRQIIAIPNKNPQLVKMYAKKDLFGTYSFQWLGAQSFQDSQERADKFLEFFKVLLDPNVFQLLQQQLAVEKKKINLVNIFETYYSYGLGERGLGSIIVPFTEQDEAAANKPSPEQQAAQAQQEAIKAQSDAKMQDHQLKQQHLQQKVQTDSQKASIDIQSRQMELQAKVQELQIEQQKAQLELQALTAKLHLEAQANQQEHKAKILSIHAKQLDTTTKMSQQDTKSKIIDQQLADKAKLAKQRKVT